LTVVTALTAQDTRGVRELKAVETGLVARQAEVLLEDLPIAAIKIGVMGSSQNVATIARVASRHRSVPVVLDPVLTSGRGDPLTDEGVQQAMRRELFPLVCVLTPNSQEARRLADDDRSPASADLAECARRLAGRGCEYVLITGTHEPAPDVVNRLYRGSELVREDRWPRLPGEYHGSGCTLASAIAAQLARGREVAEAVAIAQRFTWDALAAGFRPGAGQHLPDRFFGCHDA
jgi:hydroxymethylpyrimidine/phosphomethylpyrimidine kinase